jgi:ring-1,2-phenylacetyl-CoA epoxidase subunit PaaD
MVAAHPTTTEVWKWLGAIADPEIPVVSITDLGIVRDVQWNATGDELIITITPTYSGCPAMDVIREEIGRSVRRHGIDKFQLLTKLSPPWTTDWMCEDAKQRLREFGIAPPLPRARGSEINAEAGASGSGALLTQIEAEHPACPRCGSVRTQLVSRFGSTPCKALYKCSSCLEPFDAFKRH